MTTWFSPCTGTFPAWPLLLKMIFAANYIYYIYLNKCGGPCIAMGSDNSINYEKNVIFIFLSQYLNVEEDARCGDVGEDQGSREQIHDGLQISVKVFRISDRGKVEKFIVAKFYCSKRLCSSNFSAMSQDLPISSKRLCSSKIHCSKILPQQNFTVANFFNGINSIHEQ